MYVGIASAQAELVDFSVPSSLCGAAAAGLMAVTVVRLPVQAHPGLMVASMPWLGGRDFKRLCAWMPHAAATLVLARDRGSGRVTIGRNGLPRLHYWPSKHDRESMMQVTASGRWPGDQVTGCASKQWLAAYHAAASGKWPATLKRVQPACTTGVKAFDRESMTNATASVGSAHDRFCDLST